MPEEAEAFMFKADDEAKAQAAAAAQEAADDCRCLCCQSAYERFVPKFLKSAYESPRFWFWFAVISKTIHLLFQISFCVDLLSFARFLAIFGFCLVGLMGSFYSRQFRAYYIHLETENEERTNKIIFSIVFNSVLFAIWIFFSLGIEAFTVGPSTTPQLKPRRLAS